MTDVAITVLVLVVAVAAFVWNRLPVEIVALGVALALFGTGVISLDEAFSGFGSGTVVLIAALFVVAEGIDAAGITTWLGGLLIRFAGTSRVRLVLLMMGITALLTAFISVNGAVAALLPMVVVLAVRLGRRPAQLLMPMAFAAHAGSLLVLTGSPVNILILNAALDSTGRGIGFFEFGLVGLPLLVGTMGLAVWLGPKLLPDRSRTPTTSGVRKVPQVSAPASSSNSPEVSPRSRHQLPPTSDPGATVVPAGPEGPALPVRTCPCVRWRSEEFRRPALFPACRIGARQEPAHLFRVPAGRFPRLRRAPRPRPG